MISIYLSKLTKISINLHFAEMEPRKVYMAIQGDYRHPKPDDCPEPVYEVMLSCWNADPSARPSFAELHSTLKCFDTNDDERYSERCLLCLHTHACVVLGMEGTCQVTNSVKRRAV